MKPAVSVSFALLVTVLLVGCRSPYYADKGAALGGVAGGLAGAALGDQSGHAAGGALMGSAVGALTGAAIGDSMDAEVDRRQAMVQTQQRLANAVSTTDVTAMSASGLGEDVIINHIRANGVRASLTPGEIIELHENGVSEPIIIAMQRAKVLDHDGNPHSTGENRQQVVGSAYQPVEPPGWTFDVEQYGPSVLVRSQPAD
mgnify:CR=1 FL=1